MVVSRCFLIPTESTHTVDLFIIHLITYLQITLISAGLMKYARKVKSNQLELTAVLTKALESRDSYTMQHSENVAKYSVLIAEKMKLSKYSCDTIRLGALLHDLGKIGIPEHILTKKGKLTVEEYNTIKEHPTIGYNMMKHINEFHKNGVLDIILYHHERYDGRGYPSGLKGSQIPLYARIVAVADTFDAMTSKRVYRDEIRLKDSLHEIRTLKGLQFDPDIVDVLLSLFEEKQFERETIPPDEQQLSKLKKYKSGLNDYR